MPPPKSTRVLTESRVRELIAAIVRKEFRKEAALTVPSTLVTLGVTFDGGAEPVTVGAQAEIQVEEAFTISKWFLLSDQVGDIVIDVWKDIFASYPPDDADTITAANEPAITASNKGTDSTLSGWTTSVADGDIIKFNVDSVTTIRRCTLLLIGNRT